MQDTFLEKEKEIYSLNELIINTTSALMNMCNNMIEKTTSVLPLSYSYKLTTDFELYSEKKEEKKEGFISYFSSSTQITVTDIHSDLKEQIAMDLYEYQQYRAAINSRETFLNSLCDNTFEDSFTLLYDSKNDAISFTYDPNKINYYIIIVQNIIDNSYIRNLKKKKKK